jgi:hypothetical protein
MDRIFLGKQVIVGGIILKWITQKQVVKTTATLPTLHTVS